MFAAGRARFGATSRLHRADATQCGGDLRSHEQLNGRDELAGEPGFFGMAVVPILQRGAPEHRW